MRWQRLVNASNETCPRCATYEAIPAELIVRAGFLAAGEILRRAEASPNDRAPASTTTNAEE
jgi:hypothetical protein